MLDSGWWGHWVLVPLTGSVDGSVVHQRWKMLGNVPCRNSVRYSKTWLVAWYCYVTERSQAAAAWSRVATASIVSLRRRSVSTRCWFTSLSNSCRMSESNDLDYDTCAIAKVAWSFLLWTGPNPVIQLDFIVFYFTQIVRSPRRDLGYDVISLTNNLLLPPIRLHKLVF